MSYMRAPAARDTGARVDALDMGSNELLVHGSGLSLSTVVRRYDEDTALFDVERKAD